MARRYRGRRRRSFQGRRRVIRRRVRGGGRKRMRAPRPGKIGYRL